MHETALDSGRILSVARTRFRGTRRVAAIRAEDRRSIRNQKSYDPQAAIKTIEAFDLGSPDLREGALYRDSQARGSGTFTKAASRSDGATFTVVMEIDPEAIHRTRAEADVVVAEIMQRPIPLDAATRKRAKERVSGTVSVTFDTDANGGTLRRTKVTKLQTKRSDGQHQIDTITETIERRLVSGLTAER